MNARDDAQARVWTHEELKQAVGQEIHLSDWVLVDQARIDRFADATGDHQWIHVDRERAKASPFGNTIAHGYLTLSLIAGFSHQGFRIQERMSINYGLNKVRFPSPVPEGSRVRARFVIKSVEEADASAFGPDAKGLQIIATVTIEREGSDKPACVAETVRLSFA